MDSSPSKQADSLLPNAATPFQCFEVPLIFTRNEHEFHNQMINTMSYLRTCIETSFQMIRERIDCEKSRLQQIQARASTAESKIKSISKTENAVVVFSSAKYPAPSNVTDTHAPVMADVKPTNIEHPPYSYPAGYSAQTEVSLEVDDKTVSDCSKYSLPFEGRYLPKIPSARNEKVSENEGLGRSPPELNSVCSLLLFNTKENPYKKFPLVDNLEGAEKEERKRGANALAGPPKSIVNNTRLDLFSHHNYDFRPGVADMPFGDAPLILPGLHNVAPNLLLQTHVASIAPSACVGKNQLPTVEQTHGPSSLNLDLPLPLIIGPALSSVSAPFSQSSTSSSCSPLPSVSSQGSLPLPPLPPAACTTGSSSSSQQSLLPVSSLPTVSLPNSDFLNVSLPLPVSPPNGSCVFVHELANIALPLPLPPPSPTRTPDSGNIPTPPPLPDSTTLPTCSVTVSSPANGNIPPRGLKPTPGKAPTEGSFSSSSSGEGVRGNMLMAIREFDHTRLRPTGAAANGGPVLRVPAPNSMTASLIAALNTRRGQIHPDDDDDDDDADW